MATDPTLTSESERNLVTTQIKPLGFAVAWYFDFFIAVLLTSEISASVNNPTARTVKHGIINILKYYLR